MNMVRHQNICMDRTVCTLGILLQPLKIKQIILFSEKTCLPIISSLNDMEWHVACNESGSSWHNDCDTMDNLEKQQLIVVCPLLTLSASVICLHCPPFVIIISLYEGKAS